MDRILGAGVAASSAGASLALAPILDSIPDEWGPLGACAVGSLWFVWKMHTQALGEIRRISDRLGSMHSEAVGLREKVTANADWIRELRARTHGKPGQAVPPTSPPVAGESQAWRKP